MEVYIAMMFYPDALIYLLVLVLSMFSVLQLHTNLNRIILWNLAIRSVEETTHCGWPTVRGRDIFISSH